MVEKFVDWLNESYYTFIEWLNDVAISAFYLFLIILTLPLWLIPFIYWYFKIFSDGEICENKECEHNEDGFCMKDEYYAECPFED